MRFVALIVGAGLAVAGLAGCGSTAEPVTGPLPSIAPSIPPSAGPSVPPSTAPSGMQASGVLVTLHGTVKDGVEPGCTLLTTASDTYLLLGGDKAALKSGATVTVYGTPAPDLMTTCQQGTPFRVTRVEH